MTPEEIKKLSEAYAEYMCPVGDYCGGAYDDQRNTDLPIYKDDAKLVLTWLSERYCIVEKSKVLAEYDFNHSAAIGEVIRTGDMANKYILKRDLLESIFGKDTFEEEGE